MKTKQIVFGLATYAVVSTGQALIALAIQRGIQNAGLRMDERKRRKQKLGFH